MAISFLRRPRAHPLRQALFQVHLWSGVIAGLYLFVIGMSGALLVFRAELQARAHGQFFDVAATGAPLADAAVVIDSIRAAYPGYRFSGIDFPTHRRDTFLAYVARGNELHTVFADPYSGRVVGELPLDSWLHWVQELHYNLHAGQIGYTINGLGAAALGLMCLTGIVIWWPGVAGWGRALIVTSGRGWRRFVWELHGAIGIWLAALLLIWAVSGFYFSFPAGVRQAVDRVAPLSVVVPPRSDPAQKGTRPAPSPAALMAQARSVIPGAQLARYVLPFSESGVVQVVLARERHGDHDTSDEVTLYFDQYAGTLLAQRDRSQDSGSDRMLSWMLPLHAGTFGGLPVKVLWTLFGLGLPALFVTGFVMWWRKLA